MEKKFSLLCRIQQTALLALLLLGFSFSVFSQQNIITVRGRVGTDSVGLENVNIILKADSSKAVRSDAKGYYSITVPATATLIFSFVGYESQEIKVNGRTILNVVMRLKESDLSDVTVIGFGGTRKKTSLVSSITTINVKDLRGPTGNLTNQLAGRVAGMISFQQSGEPGLGTDN